MESASREENALNHLLARILIAKSVSPFAEYALGLARRITSTLGALLIYRLGSRHYIPVFGIDPLALDQILHDSRGAADLAAGLLIPEALIACAKVPYYFAGGSVLVLVCAVLDIEAQVRARSLTRRGGNSS